MHGFNLPNHRLDTLTTHRPYSIGIVRVPQGILKVSIFPEIPAIQKVEIQGSRFEVYPGKV
jgi:hypothetical protein